MPTPELNKERRAFAAAILLQIAVGLASLHRQGIILRDLKPSNVLLVSPTKERGFVRLLDTGIAIGTRLRRLTPPGHIVGTPLYASPEQWNEEDITPASDTYALGCIAHELLLEKELYGGVHHIRKKENGVQKAQKWLRNKIRECFPALARKDEADLWVALEELGSQHVNGPIPERDLMLAGGSLGELTALMLTKNPHKRPSLGYVIKALQVEVSHSKYSDWVGHQAMNEAVRSQ